MVHYPVELVAIVAHQAYLVDQDVIDLPGTTRLFKPIVHRDRLISALNDLGVDLGQIPVLGFLDVRDLLAFVAFPVPFRDVRALLGKVADRIEPAEFGFVAGPSDRPGRSRQVSFAV